MDKSLKQPPAEGVGRSSTEYARHVGQSIGQSGNDGNSCGDTREAVPAASDALTHAARTSDIDAKSEAELLIVCAETNFPVSRLTQFERFLWSQAFRRGVVHGIELAKDKIRAMGAA